MFVILPVHMYQSDSHREDFNDISYFKFLLKFVGWNWTKTTQISTKTYLSLRPLALIFDYNWHIVFSIRYRMKGQKPL
jgi:hypothetical protein